MYITEKIITKEIEIIIPINHLLLSSILPVNASIKLIIVAITENISQLLFNNNKSKNFCFIFYTFFQILSQQK